MESIEDSDKTKVAVINTNIGYIQRDILEIKLSLKEQFATKEQLLETARSTEVRLMRLENSSNLWRWLSPTLSAVMGSVITFLLIQYLQNVR